MSAGNFVRVVAVLAACAAALGSATSNTQQNPSMLPQHGQQPPGPPPPQDMEPARALGLWRSTFGAVKIEADSAKGGLGAGAVQGVWVYQRQGQEVIGYFSGHLRGNVLEFRWQEPSNPPLTGEGYLVFDVQGRQYHGRWWTEKRDRVGDWNGWRQGASSTAGPPEPYPAGGYGGQPYGGQPYGGYVPTAPYGGQTYGPVQPYQPYSQPPQPQPGPPPPPGRRYY